MKFEMTEAAKLRMFNHFSQDGLLTFEIHRPTKNTIEIHATNEGEPVLQMGPLELKVGDVLQLKEMKLIMSISE